MFSGESICLSILLWSLNHPEKSFPSSNILVNHLALLAFSFIGMKRTLLFFLPLLNWFLITKSFPESWKHPRNIRSFVKDGSKEGVPSRTCRTSFYRPEAKRSWFWRQEEQMLDHIPVLRKMQLEKLKPVSQLVFFAKDYCHELWKSYWDHVS